MANNSWSNITDRLYKSQTKSYINGEERSFGNELNETFIQLANLANNPGANSERNKLASQLIARIIQLTAQDIDEEEDEWYEFEHYWLPQQENQNLNDAWKDFSRVKSFEYKNSAKFASAKGSQQSSTNSDHSENAYQNANYSYGGNQQSQYQQNYSQQSQNQQSQGQQSQGQQQSASQSSQPDHYAELGVNRNSSQREIKMAYYQKAKTNHPDKEGGSTEKMQATVEAYETLSDPNKRSNYDQNNPEAGKAKTGSEASQGAEASASASSSPSPSPSR